MGRLANYLFPSGPVHLACLLTGFCGIGSFLVAYALLNEASHEVVLGIGSLGIAMLVSMWGLWRFKRWGWVLATASIAGLWTLSMLYEIWLGIFYSLAVLGYLVLIRNLFLNTKSVIDPTY